MSERKGRRKRREKTMKENGGSKIREKQEEESE